MFCYVYRIAFGSFFALFLLLLSPVAAYSAVFSEGDEQRYQQAIEDFRFGDFDTALKTLQSLQQQYPQHAGIAEHIGRCFEESGRSSEAVSLYGHWLKDRANPKASSNRFAWLGLAKNLVKLGRHQSAVNTLQQWRSYAPNDMEAAILQGSTLFRLKQYKASMPIWKGILGYADSSLKDQAAAHYYQAFIAYSKGDLEEQRKQARLSLEKDPDGPYAHPAKQFLDAVPTRVLGLIANVGLEFNYTSNVELLPDISTPVGGGSKADVVTQPTLSLLYNFEQASLGYVFSRSFHNKRSDLDLGYHSVYSLWRHGGWYITPRLEYMMLGGKFLTWSAGSDLGWRNKRLKLMYNLHYNQYSKNLKSSDLRHLGGITNTLSGEAYWSLDNTLLSVNANIANLAAKGDVLLYAKSDSYWQSGGGASAAWSNEKLRLLATFNSYYRQYKEAAPTNTALVRRDSNITLSARGSYLIRQTERYQARATANTGWQKNNSNDSTKGYKEWHAGAGIQVDW